jgi:hypothetical protein
MSCWTFAFNSRLVGRAIISNLIVLFRQRTHLLFEPSVRTSIGSYARLSRPVVPKPSLVFRSAHPQFNEETNPAFLGNGCNAHAPRAFFEAIGILSGATTMTCIWAARNSALPRKFPWFYQARGWAGLIVLVGGGAVVFANGLGLLAGLLVLAGLALFIANQLPIWTTEIGVTNQRLIFKRELLWPTTQELIARD